MCSICNWWWSCFYSNTIPNLTIDGLDVGLDLSDQRSDDDNLNASNSFNKSTDDDGNNTPDAQLNYDNDPNNTDSTEHANIEGVSPNDGNSIVVDSPHEDNVREDDDMPHDEYQIDRDDFESKCSDGKNS